MSNRLEDIADAIERALDTEPADHVLSAVAGCLVGLMEGLITCSGGDPTKEVLLAGGAHRDITIHAKKH